VAIFLGIDGGGTKTTCAVGDDHSLLASATTGASNIIRVGEDEARISLQAAIRQSCAAAGINPEAVARVCIGMSGGARPQTSEIVRRIVSELVPCEIEIVGDMVTALRAAFASSVGVLVVAGTGSIGYGRNQKGETARAGGWGFAISDEGSGHWIGRSAVTAALRAYDEGESSSLFHVISKAWGTATLDDLVKSANSTPPPDFSKLFSPVLTAADAGDGLARSVLTQAGSELARVAKIVIARIFPEEPSIPVAMSGSVFRNSALVRQVFYNSLRSEYPQAAVASTVIEPVKGALELARAGAVAANQ
jgi:glucosamine kinase